MTRIALAISIALAALAMFGLGWLGCWLWLRTGFTERAEGARLAEPAAQMHAAEAARDAAERRAQETEAARLIAETAIPEARAEVEAEMRAELAEMRAERDSAMESIGAARREAADWRRAYEAIMKEDREDP